MARSAGADWWRHQAALPSSGLPAVTVRGHDSAVPFAALMVFTFILLLNPQLFIRALAPARIALLAGAFAVGAHCWTRFAARQPLTCFTREIGLAAALLGWAIITIPFSMYLGGSVLVLTDQYLKALIVFWLLANIVTTLERLRAVVWGLSLMAVPLAATGLQNFVLHRTLVGAPLGLGGRISGYASGNPNDLALMLNLILPLTVGLFLITQRPVARGLLAGLIALDVSAIIVTFSRGGFLSLLTSFFLYLYSLHRSGGTRWVVAALVLAVAAVPLLPSGYLDRVGTIINPQADQTGSSEQRWELTRGSLIFVVSHPIVGAGIGMNVLALNENLGPTWRAVHNVYLEYAVDLGLTGSAIFILLLLSCIRSAARVRDHSAGLQELSELSGLAEAIRVALLTFAVAGLFFPVAYHFYFYYVAGLAVPLPAIYAASARRIPSRGPAPARGVHSEIAVV